MTEDMDGNVQISKLDPLKKEKKLKSQLNKKHHKGDHKNNTNIYASCRR